MSRHVMTTILLTVGVYLLLQNTSMCAASPAPRPYPRNPHHSPRAVELNFQDEDEAMEKRQFNDYGHMRFGKRSGGEEKFDDYGYMRFGRGFV